MLDIFWATLDPMLTLFLCIAVGFVARKARLLPDNTGKVLAKLETWILCPALNFSTMATYCTLSTLKTHAVNLSLSIFCVALSMTLAILLGRVFVKKKTPERGIYMYALAFANGGYIGDPVVRALFGDLVFSYYKLFYLPFSIMIYTWGISVLVPDHGEKKRVFKKILNAPTVATFLGIAVGLSGLSVHIPTFVTNSLDSLKACMGPVAMLLAGFIIAGYRILPMLRRTRVYAASLLRLFVLPTVIVLALFGAKELCNLLFSANIGNSVLFLAFFATACPLGLNTIVFPEAYGGDSETGAGMALISHTLGVVSIPIMYALCVQLFGAMAL